MGWADEWPDQCDRGHFIIESPQWVDDFGTPIALAQVKRIMIAAMDVEMVEFIAEAGELTVTVDEIKKAQEPLAEMHKNKETSNEQSAGSGRPAITSSETGVSERAARSVPAIAQLSAAEDSNGEQSKDSVGKPAVGRDRGS
jgi:hypothetical protein